MSKPVIISSVAAGLAAIYFIRMAMKHAKVIRDNGAVPKDIKLYWNGWDWRTKSI